MPDRFGLDKLRLTIVSGANYVIDIHNDLLKESIISRLNWYNRLLIDPNDFQPISKQ